MKKWAIRVITGLLAVLLLAGLVMPAFATEEESATANFKKIATAEDLMAIAENPSGSYILTKDLDMMDIAWKPIDFSGVFDGNGHAILNLTLSQTNDSTAEAHDGNRKPYEVYSVGMFGKLNNAQITNLNLINVRGIVEVDVPCFMGGIAGHSIDSKVTDCTVTGTMELRAHNQIYGLAGVIGYGSGSVENCTVDVTLICADTDKATKGEQFLGGVYSTGFMDVLNTNVSIQGFASEHGYAHNGGIVGMYMQHPLGTGKTGNITGNTVRGKIKFFEDNTDRRAYCDAFAGELLVNSYVMYDNLRYFQREEVWKYDQEIRPCMCENPTYDEYTVYSNCTKYGHEVKECYGCGYMATDNYKLLEHTVTNWEIVEAPTLRTEGLSKGTCDECGAAVERKEPVVVPEETETEPTQAPEEPTEPAEPVPTTQTQAIQGKVSVLFVVLAIATVLLTLVAAFVAWEFRKEK